jgi:hypothetical protein
VGKLLPRRGRLRKAGLDIRNGRRQAQLKTKMGCRDGNTSRGFVDVRCLRPFLTLGDFEFHSVTFLQALIAVGSNRAVMHKDIRSIFTSDESVALRIVKPLHRTFQSFHVRPLRQSSLHLDSFTGVMKVAPAELWANCAAGGWGCQGVRSHIDMFIFATSARHGSEKATKYRRSSWRPESFRESPFARRLRVVQGVGLSPRRLRAARGRA